MQRKYLLIMMVVPATIVSLFLISIVMFSYNYQNKAETFWGDYFDPADENLFSDFPLKQMVPSGGPLIATVITGVCHDTQLPMVPIRPIDGGYEVLCGDGFDFQIELVNISDPELIEMLDKALTASKESKS